jgi:lincosamide nucleotidyltransferase A/C/D/E
MMTAEDVIQLYQSLTGQGFRLWICGGWGIDALLGAQTRPHKDLDVLMLLEDMPRLRTWLALAGYELKELWSENRLAADAQGTETDTAFVVRDAAGYELDVHALRLDAGGNGLPAWEAEAGFIFTSADLAGVGVIAGAAIPCLTAEMQVVCHQGYVLPAYQVEDLRRLAERFEIP